MINAAGVALLREYEGCRLQSYLDAGGVATIGYGHTEGVSLGQSCTQEQADAWLLSDVSCALNGVLGAVRVPLNENEVAACCVFAFNVGVANFRSSSVCRSINVGDKIAAARAFLLWDKARINSQLVSLPGLARRRAAEAHLFLMPVGALGMAAVSDTAMLPQPVNAEMTAPIPEETGIGTVERPPNQRSGAVSVGTAIAVATGATKEAIDKAQPVRDGLDMLGFSPEWILYALAAMLLGSLAYIGIKRIQAHLAGRA